MINHICRNCEKEFTLKDDNPNTLLIWVFEAPEAMGDAYVFCSWICVIEKIKRMKNIYQIHLPSLHFNNEKDGRTAKDFLTLIETELEVVYEQQ